MTKADKRVRLDAIIKRLTDQSPFRDSAAARTALNQIMRQVEDELSGIPANPDPINSLPDGRMYPPADDFEVKTSSQLVRTFKQTRHRTLIGQNGSLKIIQADGTVEIDLAGSDGKSITDLLSEELTHEAD